VDHERGFGVAGPRVRADPIPKRASSAPLDFDATRRAFPGAEAAPSVFTSARGKGLPPSTDAVGAANTTGGARRTPKLKARVRGIPVELDPGPHPDGLPSSIGMVTTGPQPATSISSAAY
jgi:hypothetical protein